jgi:transposase, IS5 family
MPAILLPFQPSLSPALPTVEGNVDYRQFRDELSRIDQILRSGPEATFVLAVTEHWLAQSQGPSQAISASRLARYQTRARCALRCNVARTYLQESHRKFAAHLGDSPLLQRFCLLDEIDVITVPAKSTLQRYADWGEHDAVQQTVEDLLRQAHHHPQKLQLEQPIDLEACFLDTTCLQANIHYPVDWVLLRDGTRTLTKAVDLIRQQGLRHRMEEPALFRKRMNQCCIQMTHSPKKTQGKKHRKKMLRKMDKLMGTVANHARRYRTLLDEQWEKTQWTRAQAEQVLGRLDQVLEQLPAAREQAWQRIIDEELVVNEDKILSLYESAIRVVVRHKAGAEVEFGNTLLLGESRQGLILHWELFEESAPADARLVQGALEKTEQSLQIEIKEVGADRGFDSASIQKWLAQEHIYNGICPRDPHQLQERLRSWKFVKLQRRRSQTEGRISIIIHNFLDAPIRRKGFAHRQGAVDWAVLTHNLWVLARLPKREVQTKDQPKAAPYRQAA